MFLWYVAFFDFRHESDQAAIQHVGKVGCAQGVGDARMRRVVNRSSQRALDLEWGGWNVLL